MPRRKNFINFKHNDGTEDIINVEKVVNFRKNTDGSIEIVESIDSTPLKFKPSDCDTKTLWNKIEEATHAPVY